MDKMLMDWARYAPNRHFTVMRNSNCTEARWRVAVWVCPEGETLEGIAGEGKAKTLKMAATKAIEAWTFQDSMEPNVARYVPHTWLIADRRKHGG